MLKSVAVALAAFGLSIAAATAAPLSTTSPVGESSLVEKVHGYHASCQLGRRGWHYHPRRGVRVACAKRPVGYVWRSYGGRVGWWHPRRRVWLVVP